MGTSDRILSQLKNRTILDQTLTWGKRRLDPYLLPTETGLLDSNKPEVGKLTYKDNNMKRFSLLFWVIVLLTPALVLAEPDADGCEDHGLFTRMKNYYIPDCVKNYDQALILLSEEVDSPMNLKPEGEKTFIRYQYGESAGTAPSYLQIRRNYQNAAKALKAKILVDRDRYTAMQIDKNGVQIYISIELFNDGRNISLTILEQKTMDQEISAKDMWPVLQKDGLSQTELRADGDLNMTVTKPVTPGVNILAPKDDGKITSVTGVPGNVWRTGTTVRIQWAWPGHESSPADVILGAGSGSSFQPNVTIASRDANGEAGWEVPYTLRVGTYTVRVQSSQNSKNYAESTVRIDYSTLKIVSPQAGEELLPGASVKVVWSFQGKPGLLKLEVIGMSGLSQVIANKLPWGSSAAGDYTWTVPQDIVGNVPCKLRLTSTMSPSIMTTSETFMITGPSITITRPGPGDTAAQGTTVPITWTYRGNIGTAVKIRVTQLGGIMPDFAIQTPAGSGGQGRFDGWKPPSSASNRDYAISVESIQNPKINSYIATPLAVPGSSSVHGTRPAPNPNATLTNAIVTFLTTSDGKELENCLTLVLFDNTGKQVASSREKCYCGAPDPNSEFVPDSTVTISFYYDVDKTAIRSSFDNIKLQVLFYVKWGGDSWKFKPTVVLYFSDGSTITKQSGEHYVAAKGADMFTGLFDGNTTFDPGSTTITDWQ
jgi:hypothetical protein